MTEIKKDNLEQPKPEGLPKMTIEAARELLNQRAKLPRHAVEEFGPRVIKMVDIIHNPDLSELDALLLSGQISLAELTDYSVIFPDAQEAMVAFRNLADEIYASMLRKNAVKKLVNRAYASNGMVKDPRVFIKFFYSIYDLAQSQMLPNNCHRDYQLDFFNINLVEKFSWAILNEVRGRFGEPVAVQLMLFLRNAVSNPDAEHEKVKKPFFGVLYSNYVSIRRASLKLNSKATSELFDSPPPETKGFAKPAIFQEIDDLSHIKKINRRVIETEHGMIRILDYFPIKMAERIAKVTVVLNKSEIRTRDGKTIFPKDSSLFLYLHRASGEILINGTQQTASAILGKERYQALKDIVYKELYGDLKGADFQDEEESAEFVTSEVKGKVENQLEEIDRLPEADKVDTTGEESPDETTAEVKPVRSKKRGKDEIRAENFHFGNLRGIKGNRVLQALRKILGDEDHVTGSHHMFIGKDGVSESVPFHGDTPVGIGLLKKCLQKLGVTPQELYSNL